MAVIGICGCDANRNGAPASIFDNGGNTVFTTTNPYGVADAAWNSSGGNDMDWNIGSNQDTIIQGVWIRPVNTSSGFTVLDGSTIQAHIDSDVTNRRVRVYRGSGTGNLLASLDDSIPPAYDWFHLGWKIKIHSSAGTIDVWIDGINVLSLTGQNTQASANAYATAVRWHVGQNESGDDYFAFDGSGSSNNDWPGICRVYTGFPDADTAVQFTPLSGTNYSNVDDPRNIDSDSSYNYSNNAGDIDRFDTSLAIPAGKTVLAVEARAVFRKDDVGTRHARSFMKSGATTVNGASILLSTSYTLQRQKFDTDPDTSAAWTDTGANAVQVGYEVVD